MKTEVIIGNEEPSVVQDFPLQGTAAGCRQTAGTLKTGNGRFGPWSCERLTVSQRHVLGDLRKEFVEGFVVFLETLLEGEKSQMNRMSSQTSMNEADFLHFHRTLMKAEDSHSFGGVHQLAPQ